jgi:nitrogen fixation NifU-like protein
MPEYIASGDNPLCGDTVTIYVTIEDNCVTKASWEGYGCELCLGSADRLMEEIEGKTPAQILEISPDELLAWYGKNQVSRMRTDCVLLPLKTLIKALAPAQS